MEEMARSDRQSTPTIKDILFHEPYRFEFHQAVKLLEYLNPKAAPLGETVLPHDEVVIVKSRIYLESLSSDIYSLENINLDSPSSGPPLLHVNFMGIAGIQGPLPFPYTEMIIQRIRSGDTSLKDFLDIFNHRLISILHRIRKQYLISLNTQSPEKTEISTGLKAFIGIGQKSLQHRLHLPDRSLLDYASLYWSHPRSAKGLECILSNYFQVPIHVEKCVGRWRSLSKDQYTRLGQKGQWQKLGQGATLGTRAWDQQNHFRLYIGPLDQRKLDLLLPNGKGFQRLKDLTQLYINPMMDFSVVYVVKKPPSTHLKTKSYLGWRAWLGSPITSWDEVCVDGNSGAISPLDTRPKTSRQAPTRHLRAPGSAKDSQLKN